MVSQYCDKENDFISKLFKAIFAALKKLLKKIWEIVKKILPLILLVVAIWFAPAISAWITSVGGPAWLSTAFSALGTIKPLLVSGWDMISSGAGALWGYAKTGWGALSGGQQLALAVGTVAALAPEETSEVIRAVGKTVGGVVGNVADGVIGGVRSGLSSLWSSTGGKLFLGFGLYLLLKD